MKLVVVVRMSLTKVTESPVFDAVDQFLPGGGTDTPDSTAVAAAFCCGGRPGFSTDGGFWTGAGAGGAGRGFGRAQPGESSRPTAHRATRIAVIIRDGRIS